MENNLNGNSMRVLILSCNTGGGHNAAGRAMEKRLKMEGQQVTMLDIMSLAGERTSKMVGNTYINVAKYTPKLFQAAYMAGDFISSARRKSPVYYANVRMAKYLEHYLQEHPADILVMPHLFPAETVTYMKRKGTLQIPSLAIATDYTCIPFWEETSCDGYVLPHPDLVSEYTKKGIPGEKLYPLGIPNSMEFETKVTKEAAREMLGLDQQAPLFLLMGGSMGFGKIRELASELSRSCREGEQIAVICGNDRKMRDSLQEEFSGQERMHILGYTTQVPLWLDACDVVYTKPGGLTSTEALVRQVPIIHTAPIPGCETKNAEFFSERGMSVAEKSVTMQVEIGKRLLQDEALRSDMIRAQQKNGYPTASRDIYCLMRRMCGLEEAAR
ncbi:MAG: glycosyltransferase [Lachnospiraceae bacterium]|nr:glycosyltransferase [Lachnospiraceae bacterium]